MAIFFWGRRELRKLTDEEEKAVIHSQSKVASQSKFNKCFKYIKKGLHKIKKGLGGKKYENKHKKS